MPCHLSRGLTTFHHKMVIVKNLFMVLRMGHTLCSVLGDATGWGTCPLMGFSFRSVEPVFQQSRHMLCLFAFWIVVTVMWLTVATSIFVNIFHYFCPCTFASPLPPSLLWLPWLLSFWFLLFYHGTPYLLSWIALVTKRKYTSIMV